MRRLPILLVLGFVFVLFAVAAATAGPPMDFCGEDGTKPDHPSCSDMTTTSSPTTTTTDTTTLETCTTEMTVTGKGNSGFECLWTPSNDGSTTATVTISGLDGGVVGPPMVFVRDDSPGDICLLVQDWADQTGPVYVAEFDLYYDEVPEGYEEWLGHSYWDFLYNDNDPQTDPIVGAHWCAAQDPIQDSIRLDTNGTPLHFMVGFNARGGGQLDITLSPEPASPTP